RLDVAAVVALLVVQVRAGRATGGADGADLLPLRHALSEGHDLAREVGVPGTPATAVVDLDPQSVADVPFVLHPGDSAARGRGDRVTVVVRPVVVDGVRRAVTGPRRAGPGLIAGERVGERWSRLGG